MQKAPLRCSSIIVRYLTPRGFFLILEEMPGRGDLDLLILVAAEEPSGTFVSPLPD